MELEEKEPKDENEAQENGAFECASTESVDSLKEKIQVLLGKTPTDFGAWTEMISEIEITSPNDIKRICLVYDTFLSEFPLCYGYWKKYANHKARLCTYSEVEEVFERAVDAAGYSVDLWASYCSFAVSSYADPVDIRRLFQRGLSFVGKDYLCHLLWDKYIEFEYSQKEWSSLAHIYLNTLKFPIKKLHSYYDSFKKLVALWEEEIGSQKNNKFSSQAVANGETIDVMEYEYSGSLNVVRDLLDQQNCFLGPNAVKKYLKVGELLYQRSSLIESKIRNFESQIRRRYFHVKPLESSQLENWHRYLDFVEMQADFDWTVKLYERSLIPCANYPEFWIRYSEFVNAKGGREIANHALCRARTIFLKGVPAFNLYCAMFREQTGDVLGARALVPKCGASLAPELVENVSREANMEKRVGNVEAAYNIYEKAIDMAKEKQNLEILSVLYIGYARFTFVASGSIDTAGEVFIKGIRHAPCKSIIEGFIQFLTLHGGAGQLPKLESIVVNAIAPESDLSRALGDKDREEISRLFLEFLDLYGTIHEIRKAWDRHWKLFPHIMRPTYCTATENSNINKEKDGRLLVAPSRHASEDNNHGGSDEHLMDHPSKDIADMHPETATICTVQPDEDKSVTGAIICRLQAEGAKSGMEEIEEKVALPKVQEQSILEGVDLHEVVHECPAFAQIPNAPSEQSEIENQVISSPDRETGDTLIPSAPDNLSIKCPETDAQQSNRTALHDNIAHQEAITVSEENQIPSRGDMEKAVMIHGTPSRANLYQDDSPLHSASDPLLQEVQNNRQIKVQVQSRTNSEHDLPVTIAYSQNASSRSWAQMSSNRQTPEGPSSSSHGHVQSSEPQQRQVHTQTQCPPGASNSQMPLSKGYPCQPQAWTSVQDQHSNNAETQYQMAVAQVYSTGSLSWPVQNMQQQGFAYAQPQPNTCPASQPQSQVYQQAQLTNEQYAYFQSHGFAPHIWHYYQQQLYYLQLQQQQQQNQQMHNHAQQQLQIGQLQQLQQEHSHPQQHPQNQQMLLQMQQQRQNQQQPNQQESQQHLSPQKNQSQHQQQQQAPQIQQQSQQLYHTQQQQHLLYVQQQHQLYLQQQQQLYMQQQLFQQQQQQQQQEPQQVVQQEQQLLQQQQQQQQQQLFQQQQQQQLSLLQQQQQQLLQLRQQHQQISASQIQTLNDNFHLQQTIPAQYAQQRGQDNGQETDPSQGEEPRLLDTEQSGSYPSTPAHRLF